MLRTLALVCRQEWRKRKRLGNACCFDSPVCGAKLSSCFNRAKGGQVWMGIGVVLYRVSLAVFSFDQRG